jgi:hypothetical protein
MANSLPRHGMLMVESLKRDNQILSDTNIIVSCCA